MVYCNESLEFIFTNKNYTWKLEYQKMVSTTQASQIHGRYVQLGAWYEVNDEDGFYV